MLRHGEDVIGDHLELVTALQVRAADAVEELAQIALDRRSAGGEDHEILDVIEFHSDGAGDIVGHPDRTHRGGDRLG